MAVVDVVVPIVGALASRSISLVRGGVSVVRWSSSEHGATVKANVSSMSSWLVVLLFLCAMSGRYRTRSSTVCCVMDLEDITIFFDFFCSKEI